MEELADMTDNFNEKNLIGETLFSKLYRGTIRHGWLPFEDWVVTVKIWDYTRRTSCYLNANETINVYIYIYMYVFTLLSSCNYFLCFLFLHLKKVIIFYMICDRKT